MNKYVKSTVVLFSICLVVSVLLALVNFITAPVIEESKKAEIRKSLIVVLPDAEDFEEFTLTEEIPETVTSIYKDTAGTGYAITLATKSQYSEDYMLITVGIDSSLLIKNVVITAYSDSKSLPEAYPSTYIGKDATLAGADLVSGVTYSSRAFKEAIADAFTGLNIVLATAKEAA